MRMLLKAVLDTEAANEVFRSGEAAEALDRIHEALQPEALYSFVEDGQRAFFAVFDLADPSEIPVISEPLYQRANVKLTLTPCMTLEDVKKGLRKRPAGWLPRKASQFAESRHPTSQHRH
jgi:hypothetical protein